MSGKLSKMPCTLFFLTSLRKQVILMAVTSELSAAATRLCISVTEKDTIKMGE